MFMNILVGVMAAIAILAGVWGFWVDHRKDKDLTDETSAAGSAVKTKQSNTKCRDRHPGIFFLDKYFFIAVRYV